MMHNSNHTSGNLFKQNRASYVSTSSFKEKHSIQEKRMLRLSFDQIQEVDPLNLKKKFKQGQDPQFVSTFYSILCTVPISIVLGVLFYSLWYTSPKTTNLRIYQQDIFQWNQDRMADKMTGFDFQFEVFPVPTNHRPGHLQKRNMTLMEKPMSFEKDEIKLREKFFYKQAYFYSAGALKAQNISDQIWVSKNIDHILDEAARLTGDDNSSISESQKFCLNAYYKPKADAKSKFKMLHSKNTEDDTIEVEEKVEKKPSAIAKIESRNPFRPKPESSDQDAADETQTVNVPCLVQFGIWKEVFPSGNTYTDNLIQSVEDLKDDVEDTILDTDDSHQRDCEDIGFNGKPSGNGGIFTNGQCRYFDILKRLCIKISFLDDADEKGDSLYFENGCYSGMEPTQFKNAEVGKYYDFSNDVSLEVRSTEDPYMVFAYTRDNLGMDFTVFLYLALFAAVVGSISALITLYYYSCSLEPLRYEDPEQRRLVAQREVQLPTRNLGVYENRNIDSYPDEVNYDGFR